MLTSSQRAKLRGMAQNLSPIFNVGKNGITDNFVSDVLDALAKKELIKIGVLKGAELSAKDAMSELCERTGAEAVGAIGSKFVVYKRSDRDDVEHIAI